MNPLQLLFFVALFIDDYFFKDGKLVNMFAILVIGYWIVNICSNSNKFQTSERKLHQAKYSQSVDPTVISKIKFRSEKASKFLDLMSKKYGKKFTWTLYVAKCVGSTIVNFPEVLLALRFGKPARKKGVDVSVLVNIDGKGLGISTLRNANLKSLEELHNEIYPDVQSLKQGKNKDFNKQMGIVNALPSFLLGFLMDTMGYIQNCLGFGNRTLGLIEDQFGTIMISSLGGFGLDEAIAPLCPMTHTAGVISILAEQHRKKLKKDGTFEEYRYLPLTIALDHRFMDGLLGVKLINKFRGFFENPETLYTEETDIAKELISV